MTEASPEFVQEDLRPTLEELISDIDRDVLSSVSTYGTHNTMQVARLLRDYGRPLIERTLPGQLALPSHVESRMIEIKTEPVSGTLYREVESAGRVAARFDRLHELADADRDVLRPPASRDTYGPALLVREMDALAHSQADVFRLRYLEMADEFVKHAEIAIASTTYTLGMGAGHDQANKANRLELEAKDRVIALQNEEITTLRSSLRKGVPPTTPSPDGRVRKLEREARCLQSGLVAALVQLDSEKRRFVQTGIEASFKMMNLTPPEDLVADFDA